MKKGAPVAETKSSEDISPNSSHGDEVYAPKSKANEAHERVKKHTEVPSLRCPLKLDVSENVIIAATIIL